MVTDDRQFLTVEDDYAKADRLFSAAQCLITERMDRLPRPAYDLLRSAAKAWGRHSDREMNAVRPQSEDRPPTANAPSTTARVAPVTRGM